MSERVVDEFQSPLEAEEALAVLLQGGISGRVQERAASGVDQYLHPAGRWYELRVREEDAEKALPIIATFRQDVARDAAESEQAAADESGAPPAPETDQPRGLGPWASLGGTLLQVHAALEIAALFAMARRDMPTLVFGVLAAGIDFALGAFIRQGGRNAARVAMARLGLTALWLGAGALFALPNLAPLFSVAPLIALTLSMALLLFGPRREAGLVLFLVYAGVMGANTFGVFDRAAAAMVRCPAASSWILPGRYAQLDGAAWIQLCGDGRLTLSAGGQVINACWTAEGEVLTIYDPGRADSRRNYEVQSAENAQCTLPDCKMMLARHPYRLESARGCE
jgi:hypothetical protein